MRGSIYSSYININEELAWLRHYYFNGVIYRDVVNNKYIGVVRLDDHSMWFECFNHPEGSYVFSSQSLVDCCEWLGVPYYNYK